MPVTASLTRCTRIEGRGWAPPLVLQLLVEQVLLLLFLKQVFALRWGNHKVIFAVETRKESLVRGTSKNTVLLRSCLWRGLWPWEHWDRVPKVDYKIRIRKGLTYGCRYAYVLRPLLQKRVYCRFLLVLESTPAPPATVVEIVRSTV